MSNNDLPLISCICITNNRPQLLQRALSCFGTQDYPRKELVISYPEGDFLTENLIDQISLLSAIQIVKIERKREETLGLARNSAILAANGRYICIWDDDDWHHPNRLSQQFSVIENGPFKASILMNVLMHDVKNKETYYSGYRDWEGTLLCKKQTILKTGYLDLEKGEDTFVLHYLLFTNVLFRIIEKPNLYVYIYHGNNTWGENHFRSYFSEGKRMNEAVNSEVLKAIDLSAHTSFFGG
ncbi:Glycosyltransferase involved in cell wall bisynthesis [Pedobacter steynii]|uniref:Glycosyltransferase involved in cell wall bisynthesis n=1 Tax=Pedobacter steynii TaxID=430522 RepID=A0A1G9RV74_9SPHI|nr:glycosyltransferase [Pedobacter steynii]NQX37632.1 glycosyltransferase [Pedobacter steynii]SDM27159.1 Glycosyltransferase involved in cell wall bisynthesis [Pedobacter steynii]